MRRAWILGLPGAILALGGTYIYYLAWKAPREVPGLLTSSVRHIVTPSMEKETAAQSRDEAPTLELKDVEGKPVALGGVRKGPQFLYFIKKGCPCSYDAEPLFQDLYRHFKGEVAFVSVSDADEKDAKRWWTELNVPYPVVSDTSLASMKAYQARASVYSALLDKEGRMVKVWPGYSKGILLEMNKTMAAELGEAARPFDTKYAPEIKAAGCAFAGQEIATSQT